MDIEEIRNNIKKSSTVPFINDIVEYFVHGSFLNKKITSIKDLFSTSPNNMSAVDKEGYSAFVNGVLFKDYCEHLSINYDAITDFDKKKEIVQQFINTCKKGNKFSYDCSFLYDSHFDFRIYNISLVMNVKGSDIYKALAPIYEKLKGAHIPCNIEVPLTKAIPKGYTDSILINIPISYLEEVVNLIHGLSLPTTNLFNKPSMLYASVNEYIGFDNSCNPDENIRNMRSSDVLCEVIEDSINRVVDDMLTKYGNETFQNDSTFALYREQSSNKLEANLQIFYRIVSVDISYKEMLTDYIMDGIKQKNGCEYVYTNVDFEKRMNMFFGTQPSAGISSLLNSIEVDVAKPQVSFENVPEVETIRETDNQISDGIQVQNIEPTLEKKDEKTLQEEFSNRGVSTEAYLDGLLAQVSKEPISHEEKIEERKMEVPSIPIENLNDSVELSQPVEEDSLIAERPQSVSVPDLKFVEATLAELDKFNSGFDEVMESLNGVSNDATPSLTEDPDKLSVEEIQNLSNSDLDQHMDYERALKYQNLVDNIGILNSNVPGTDFKLLDYFDAQQVDTKISPTTKYKIYTDDIYDGRQFINECVIKYVLGNGNVPIDDVISAYGAEALEEVNEQRQQKGLFGLFRKKSQ